MAWRSIETDTTVVFYQSVKDLGKFCTKVKCYPHDWGVQMLLSDAHEETLREIVTQKSDTIFMAVQNVLGMHKKMDKVHIRLYPNEKQLKEAYTKIYNKTCTLRAWYRHTNNTVYVNANDLHEGVLAHELTHAITDNYLLVRPPRQTAEIIARYVGGNLKKNVRSSPYRMQGGSIFGYME